MRDQIVATARSYLSVRFRHQGRVRAGLDCVGLVIRVAHDLGLSDFDATGYSRMPDGVRLQATMEEQMARVTDYRPGDVLLMRFEQNPQHVAIVGDYLYGGLSIIHALATARRVVETRLDDVWKARIVAAYQFKGID
jgi:cell wall-associated NlpC family hydrolase